MTAPFAESSFLETPAARVPLKVGAGETAVSGPDRCPNRQSARMPRDSAAQRRLALGWAYLSQHSRGVVTKGTPLRKFRQ
jgi:hypothetical protein